MGRGNAFRSHGDTPTAEWFMMENPPRKWMIYNDLDSIIRAIPIEKKLEMWGGIQPGSLALPGLQLLDPVHSKAQKDQKAEPQNK